MSPGTYEYHILKDNYKNSNEHNHGYKRLASDRVRFVMDKDMNLVFEVSIHEGTLEVRVAGRGPTSVLLIEPHSANVIHIGAH